MVTGARTLTRLTDRLSTAVVVLASIGFGVAICWGIAARVGAGHDAIVASRGMMAENMITWGIGGPVREYTLDRPGHELYYAHHPFGTYWWIWLFARVLGRHAAYVPRIAAVTTSLLTLPLLYAVGRRLWGSACGALVVLGFVALPITMSFGNFPGFEVPIVFSCLLTTWGYLRFTERWQRRWMAVSLLGVLIGCNVDWMFVLFLGAALGILTLGIVFLPKRWAVNVPLRPYVQWALLAAAVATGVVVAWAWYFHQIGAVETLLQSDAKRSRGSDGNLWGVLRQRTYWIDVMFTPLAVTLGKIAAPIFFARVFVWRRVKETFAIAILLMSVVVYVKFKNGADVHIYWPYPFAAYFALSLGLLGRCLIGIGRAALTWFGRADRRDALPLVALGVVGLVPVGMVPDSLDALAYGRATGGRYDEKGARDFRDVDKSAALEWMAAHMQPDTIVLMHESMKSTWALDWALHHKLKATKEAPIAGGLAEERYFIADLEFMHTDDQKKMADGFAVTVVDHFALVDRQVPKAPVDAYVFDEREPTSREWYLAYGTEPVRTVRPDAWATWELRDAWGQTPNPSPTAMPVTLDQVRIAHNAALGDHDDASAKALESRLVSTLDTKVAASFDDGTALVGQRLTGDVLSELSLVFQSAGPAQEDFEFDLSSTVTQKSGSLVPADGRTKQFGAPFPVPPRLWRTGYLYAEHCALRPRPGQEHIVARFESPQRDVVPPKPVVGVPPIPLLVME